MSFARGSSEDSKKRFLGSPAPLFRDARRDRAALSSRAHASLAPIFRPNGAMRAVSRATTLVAILTILAASSASASRPRPLVATQYPNPPPSKNATSRPSDPEPPPPPLAARSSDPDAAIARPEPRESEAPPRPDPDAPLREKEEDVELEPEETGGSKHGRWWKGGWYGWGWGWGYPYYYGYSYYPYYCNYWGYGYGGYGYYKSAGGDPAQPPPQTNAAAADEDENAAATPSPPRRQRRITAADAEKRASTVAARLEAKGREGGSKRSRLSVDRAASGCADWLGVTEEAIAAAPASVAVVDDACCFPSRCALAASAKCADDAGANCCVPDSGREEGCGGA